MVYEKSGMVYDFLIYSPRFGGIFLVSGAFLLVAPEKLPLSQAARRLETGQIAPQNLKNGGNSTYFASKQHDPLLPRQIRGEKCKNVKFWPEFVVSGRT